MRFAGVDLQSFFHSIARGLLFLLRWAPSHPITPKGGLVDAPHIGGLNGQN